MAKQNNYLEELRDEVKNLKDDVDIQNIELGLLKNEMTDMLQPNIELMQLSQFVLQMLSELNEYERKGKLNARMQASKDRLLKMFELTNNLSGLGDKCQSLKLFNKELFGTIQLLRIENSKLRRENENMNLAFVGL